MAKYIHTSRNSGDTILAEDWNKMGAKLESVNAKLDEENSLYTGPLTVTDNIKVNESVNLGKDIILGDEGKRFVIHSRADIKDFLQITADKIDGSWDWANGITLRKSGDVGISNTNPMAKLDVNGSLNVNAAANVKGQLTAKAISVGDTGVASIGCYDFKMGNSLRRGAPGRALVDRTDKLCINYNSDWVNGVEIHSALTVNKYLTVNAKIEAANSDIYFTKVNHNHSGFGNTAGYAAIENSKNYNTLMILGRNIGTTSAVSRQVKVWDDMAVSRHLTVGNTLKFSDGSAQSTATVIQIGTKTIGKLTGVQTSTTTITFPAFKKKPKVMVALAHIDSHKDKNLRIKAIAESITVSSFVLKVVCWSNTVLYSSTVNWIAVSS